jgi:polar amino acid transport system permease protein
MYQDTVQSDKLLQNPKVIAIFFAVVFGGLFAVNFFPLILGELLRPALSTNSNGGYYDRFVLSFTSTVLVVGALFVVGLLKFKYQVMAIWAVLLLLFLAFFYGFHLDIGFIEQKVWFMISQGVVTTLYISAISISIAFVIALVGAVSKLSSNAFAYSIATFYTSFFRGLPLLMQVYLIYIGLPQLGYVINAVPAGILALSLCYGAYMTEVFRAGISSVPKGQWEGARAMGFNFSLTMRKVILPQAIPLVIPPTGNYFIAMLKDSSLVSVIGVWELMFLARTLGQAEFKHMEMLITAAIMYWVLSMVFEFFQSRLERKFGKSTKR